MIQRIQSIYLLLAGILPAIGFCVSSAGWASDGERLACLNYLATTNAAGEATGHPWGLLVFGLLAILLPLTAIFLYTNRKRQMKMARAAQFFALLIYPTLYAYANAACRHLTECPSAGESPLSFEPGFGLALPLLAIVFAQLAYRAIRKDEELIRSADRIR